MLSRLFFLMFLAASAPVFCPAAETPKDVPIGVVLPLTGRHSMYGISTLIGALTRVEEWNDSRAQTEAPVRLLVKDTLSNPALAERYVDDFAAMGVLAIIGPVFSEAIVAAKAVAENKKIVLISPLATAQGDDPRKPWFFRLSNSNAEQARAIANLLRHDRRLKRAACLVDPRYPISRVYADRFREAMRAVGGEVAVEAAFTVAPDNIDQYPLATGNSYADALRSIADAKPEALYIPCHAPELIEIIQAIGEMPELDKVVLCGPDLWDNRVVFNGSGRRILGSLFTSSRLPEDLPYEPLQAFMASMRKAGVENPDAQTASAYDAVSLLLLGLDAIKGEKTGEALRDSLLRLPQQRLATGLITILPNGSVRKPVMVRIMREQDGWPVSTHLKMYNSVAISNGNDEPVTKKP